ncbi:MAG TPA: phospholipase D-like domain-containing protein [Kofleriaceae bacterium]|nr:phospholipase D-like domain-containing protein [Kofleriaceae bacterium]
MRCFTLLRIAPVLLAMACVQDVATFDPHPDPAEGIDLDDADTQQATATHIDLGNGKYLHALHAGPGDTRIRGKLVRLIDNAARGSSIHISFFRLGPTVYQALVAALERGVHVSAVFDGQAYGETDRMQRLASKIVAHGDRATVCRQSQANHSCTFDGAGASAKMHAKLALFSNTSFEGSGRMQASFIASANFNDHGSGTEMFNNALVFYEPVGSGAGDPGSLHHKARLYFEDMLNQARTTDYYEDVANARGHAVDFSLGTQIFMGPDANGTPVLDSYLSQIDGLGAADGTCRVLVNQGILQAATGIPDRLIQLRQSGCWVYVLLDDTPDNPQGPGTVIDRLVDAGIPVVLNARNHNKSIIAYARVIPFDAYATLVWTGSRQGTMGALRENDEVSTLTGGNVPLFNSFYEAFLAPWYEGRACDADGYCR